MADSQSVQELLGLRASPVAIAYLAQPPAGLPAWSGSAMPAGCAFWQQAQRGEAFYTVPADHYNCAVGAYTHALDLPPEHDDQLNQTISLMVENGYIEMKEVPGIPRLAQAPAAIAYAPAEGATFEPDVILMVVNPSQAMLVYEAGLRAGAASTLTNLMGRPSCAVLPFTVESASMAMSLGCAGNRLYAGLGDDELYVAIPGQKWSDFKARLAEVCGSNDRMKQFYVANQARIAS
jgi:uncharacterized protein (DUF169 family)